MRESRHVVNAKKTLAIIGAFLRTDGVIARDFQNDNFAGAEG